MLIILMDLRTFSTLREKQFERITSVFESEEAEKRGEDESDDEDQGVNLHSLTRRRYVGCNENKGEESTGQGAVDNRNHLNFLSKLIGVSLGHPLPVLHFPRHAPNLNEHKAPHEGK